MTSTPPITPMPLTSPVPMDELQQRVLLALLGMQRQSWEQGVAGHALLDLGRHALARVLARDAIARQTPQGRLGEIDDAGAVNSAANGEAVRHLAGDLGPTADPDPDHEAGQDGDGPGDAAGDREIYAEGDREIHAAGDPDVALARAAYRRQLEWLLTGAPRAADGTLYHLMGSRDVWVDTVYMVLPLLALEGRAGEALRQLDGHRRRLFVERHGLYAHQWDDAAGALRRAALWASGNGWVAAGIARALHHLHDDDGPDAARFRAVAAPHARTVIDACVAHRTPAGLLHDVLDDPATFEDATAALMLAYAAFTGVADGWLDAGYTATARSLLDAATTRVDGDGVVTGVCGSPRFDRSGHSAEAQSFFLLASAAQARTRELASTEAGADQHATTEPDTDQHATTEPDVNQHATFGTGTDRQATAGSGASGPVGVVDDPSGGGA